MKIVKGTAILIHARELNDQWGRWCYTFEARGKYYQWKTQTINFWDKTPIRLWIGKKYVSNMLK